MSKTQQNPVDSFVESATASRQQTSEPILDLLNRNSNNWQVLLCRQPDKSSMVILRPRVGANHIASTVNKEENWEF